RPRDVHHLRRKVHDLRRCLQALLRRLPVVELLGLALVVAAERAALSLQGGENLGHRWDLEARGPMEPAEISLEISERRVTGAFFVAWQLLGIRPLKQAARAVCAIPRNVIAPSRKRRDLTRRRAARPRPAIRLNSLAALHSRCVTHLLGPMKWS